MTMQWEYVAIIAAMGAANGYLWHKMNKFKRYHASMKFIYYKALDSIEDYAELCKRQEKQLKVQKSHIKELENVEYVKCRIMAEARKWKQRYRLENFMRDSMIRNAAAHKNITQSIIDRAVYCDRTAMVKKWRRAMGLWVNPSGAWKTMEISRLKKIMNVSNHKLKEELNEAKYAAEVPPVDVKGYVDAMIDIMYVAEGALCALGVDGNKAFNAVQKSNMTKDKNLFIRDGVGKGHGYKSPDWDSVLNEKN